MLKIITQVLYITTVLSDKVIIACVARPIFFLSSSSKHAVHTKNLPLHRPGHQQS